jgi:hypothetical protein
MGRLPEATMTSEPEFQPLRSSDQPLPRPRVVLDRVEPVVLRRPSRDGSGHPRGRAILLMVAVSLFLVGVSIASVY